MFSTVHETNLDESIKCDNSTKRFNNKIQNFTLCDQKQITFLRKIRIAE